NRIITPDQRDSYRGQKLGQAVAAGQPIYLSDFALGGDFEIKEPYRLFTIAANPNMVICGDWVKICDDNGLFIGGGPFRVVAVGGIIRTNRNPATTRHDAADRSLPKHISLEVTEAQISELAKGTSSSPDKNRIVICPPPTGTAQPEANR
ncbi:MAG: hypothetical protein FWD53_11265, partial [Phycisphaerales bacterium]|nr:hypothetical protein [Phycisphaerales bacterium]